jgi:hypothetical protein
MSLGAARCGPAIDHPMDARYIEYDYPYEEGPLKPVA